MSINPVEFMRRFPFSYEGVFSVEGYAFLKKTTTTKQTKKLINKTASNDKRLLIQLYFILWRQWTNAESLKLVLKRDQRRDQSKTEQSLESFVVSYTQGTSRTSKLVSFSLFAFRRDKRKAHVWDSFSLPHRVSHRPPLENVRLGGRAYADVIHPSGSARKLRAWMFIV